LWEKKPTVINKIIFQLNYCLNSKTLASETVDFNEVIMPPRTIDNLGIDVSTRYAEDQRHLDDKLIKDTRGLSPQTQVDVTSPSFPSEFDTLFDLSKKNLSWADFQAPLRFNEQKKRLFTHQLIPSIGSPDKKESQAQKINAKVQSQIIRNQADKDSEKDPKKKFAQDREEKELNKEKKVLLKLLDCIVYLDRDVGMVNARRLQYQKG